MSNVLHKVFESPNRVDRYCIPIHQDKSNGLYYITWIGNDTNYLGRSVPIDWLHRRKTPQHIVTCNKAELSKLVGEEKADQIFNDIKEGKIK